MKKCNPFNITFYSFNLSFSYENEYISKPFSFYTSKPINKIFFLSNLYKIFIVNIPQTLTFSIFDFYSLIILLCPDFPKTIIKKLSILISNFSNNNLTPEAFNENIELKQRVNIIEIFSMFCAYFIYSDFFFELDKIFVHANVPSLSVKELKKVKGIKKEFLYQIMILCVPALLEEYNLNTVSTFEDVEEIIEKGNDHKINYSTLNEKTLKNKAIILDIFNIDSIAYNYLYLLNCLTFNTE